MPSDAEAIAFAEASAEGQRVEVWNRARLVSRIDPVRQQA
jgi:hypothetical protein